MRNGESFSDPVCFTLTHLGSLTLLGGIWEHLLLLFISFLAAQKVVLGMSRTQAEVQVHVGHSTRAVMSRPE